VPRIALALFAACFALAVAAPAAQACTDAPLSRPFLPWLDLAWYEPAPDGGFEAGADGWTLDGAAVVSGGQPWGGDHHSLSLPAGASATSAPVCVTLAHPTIRFFARGSGVLTVTVLAGGLELPVGAVAGGGSWSPSSPMPVVANLLGAREVRFRLSSGGPLQVDDLWVDPYSKG
jgi:hypothetical protein